MEEHLAKKQKEVDKLYEEHGLTDEVLDKQIEINKLRHAHDISDKTNRVNGDYVQQVNKDIPDDASTLMRVSRLWSSSKYETIGR